MKNAQKQVSGVVKNQGDTVDQFQTGLLEPLMQYSQEFKGISSSSNNAAEVMNGFNTIIQNSNASFTQIISVDKTYEMKLLKLKSCKMRGLNRLLKEKVNWQFMIKVFLA